MKVRASAAWVSLPLGTVFLWLLFGFRPFAIIIVAALVLVTIGVVWPLERGERIVRLHR